MGASEFKAVLKYGQRLPCMEMGFLVVTDHVQIDKTSIYF